MKTLNKSKLRNIELVIISIAIPLLMVVLFQTGRLFQESIQLISSPVCEASIEVNRQADTHGGFAVIEAETTGFNTVPEQTDNRPCESASGDWICGRDDVVACPPDIPFHTWIEIDGKRYECLDRTASRYSHRFDISFDKNIQLAKNWGVKTLPIKLFNYEL